MFFLILHYCNKNRVKKNSLRGKNTQYFRRKVWEQKTKSLVAILEGFNSNVYANSHRYCTRTLPKKRKSAVFQLLFCLLPHSHFSSHSCPGAVPLSSSQLSLLFHQLRPRYERKANVLASHDGCAACGGVGGMGGAEWRGPQRNFDVPLQSRDTGGGCTS